MTLRERTRDRIMSVESRQPLLKGQRVGGRRGGAQFSALLSSGNSAKLKQKTSALEK